MSLARHRNVGPVAEDGVRRFAIREVVIAEDVVGDHYRENHPSIKAPLITFNILSRNDDTLRVHIEGAIEI